MRESERERREREQLTWWWSRWVAAPVPETIDRERKKGGERDSRVRELREVR